MSEAGHERNQRDTYQRRIDAVNNYARGKDLSSWRKTVRSLPIEGGDTRTFTRGNEKFTIGSYKMKKLTNETPEVFHMNILRVTDEVMQTVIRKQNDYGPNNIQRSPYGPITGLTVRLYDKIARLAWLTRGNRKPENESLRDTFVDIAGYGLLGLMVLDGTFPKEQ